MKKSFISLLLASLLFSLLAPVMPAALAASQGDVVMNEIAWAGSPDSSGDEYLELFNNTNSDIDLTDWVIVDDDSSTYELAGTINAKSYFLIEDTEDTVSSLTADLVVGMSLANTGDKLVLKDNTGKTIDVVNGAGGAWYAGDNTTKATMERVDASAMIDSAANWADNTESNGAKASGGSQIQGTPGSKNSVSEPDENAAQIDFNASDSTPDAGQEITVSVDVSNLNDLFAYGFDLSYDPAVLEYKSASRKSFLSAGGTVSTSFNAALENGVEGKLIVGEARLMESKTGASGAGQLFTIVFTVVGNEADTTALDVAGSSFLANPTGDIAGEFNETEITVASGSGSYVNPVQNVTAAPATERYQTSIAWDAPVGGADSYKIMRKNQVGVFTEIGETEELSFIDQDSNEQGGKIIPGVIYTYQVTAVKGSNQSLPKEITAQDDRGLAGDNDRSDRIDGRDLENLAKHFGLDLSDEGYDALMDTNYDGAIDGSDLIDIGANWALTYSE